MTQSSLLEFGNKDAARWGCVQCYKSQQQQLRQEMVCLRRPSCTSAMGDQRNFCTFCSPTSHTAQHDPHPPATYCKQKPHQKHYFWCLWVPGGYHPLLPPMMQRTLYPVSPWLGTANSCFSTVHLSLPPFQTENQKHW